MPVEETREEDQEEIHEKEIPNDDDVTTELTDTEIEQFTPQGTTAHSNPEQIFDARRLSLTEEQKIVEIIKENEGP